MKSLGVILAGVVLAFWLGGCADNSNNNVNPTAANDTARTAPGAAVTVAVTANDTDPDGTIDPATVTIVSGPSNGVVTVNATTGAVTYMPNAGFVGVDTITYTVADNDGEMSNTATLTITVTAAQDLVSLVQQVLAADANDAPVDVNNLTIQNQFDAGDPMPVDAFLP
ncbi:MAG: hypothetical protein ETSY1_11685 [Candidatus Entotheonella factor]|uniref:Cadherin-like domain-containing protein n=1 Tax=Entotheonella factor TaxID=1429438 RepID=W4LQT5_ENTF1|nr:Ig-like domain-containing protein [Candidatus Entotheonella palauensis]ETX00313.1 MAG: hypothetical protein ETSY1_11685 [Candidatus Entotheonella factor]